LEKEIYIIELKKLQDLMNNTANTFFTIWAKVISLVTMNMRYEKVAFELNLNEHPYQLTKRIIEDAITQFRSLIDISFIEDDQNKVKGYKSKIKEEKHQELFNEMWDKYDQDEMNKYVQRYVHRINVNGINELIENKKCIDLGCGNGATCFALTEAGAGFVAGIDYGSESIAYACELAIKQGLKEKVHFEKKTVYETGFDDNYFDFAVQNGVFHHLDDEDKAIREAKRILKKGGWFWYYTDGEGGISYDLWDTSVEILKDVEVTIIYGILKSMNIDQNKIVHISDGLSATYAHTSWDKIIDKLRDNGFSNFKRMTGGFDTDFDLDRIEKDPYGREKFGEGDLRVLCQLVNK